MPINEDNNFGGSHRHTCCYIQELCPIKELTIVRREGRQDVDSTKVSGTVYTDAVSFVTASVSMRLRISFTRRRSSLLQEPGRF